MIASPHRSDRPITTWQECTYVDAEEGQVPQAAARADGRQGLARLRRVVRRLRAEGARAVLADGPADRGGARRDDAPHSARRQDLGARVPGQADHQEAAGNPHGQGQGRARAVGGGGPAGQGAVRDGRREREGRARGDAGWPRRRFRSSPSSRPGSRRRRCYEGGGTARPRRRRARREGARADRSAVPDAHPEVDGHSSRRPRRSARCAAIWRA